MQPKYVFSWAWWLFGTGPGALNVCANNFDCTGQSNPQTLVPLTSNQGGVQPACIATGLNAVVKSLGEQFQAEARFGGDEN